MPKKHITISESLLGLGSIIIELLVKPMTVDDCWDIIRDKYIGKGIISNKHTFDSLILALDLLYAINIIEMNGKGELYNVH